MSTSEHHDPLWQIAWDWVLREHEQSLDADTQADLIEWLKADPTHRKLYDEACRLWLLVGLVPPSDPSDDPSPEDDTPDV